jgi:hypothetical protein
MDNYFFMAQNGMRIFNTYKNYIVASIIFSGSVVAIGIYLYFSGIAYEQSAQQALADILSDFNRAGTSEELWNDVEIGSKTAYKQFERSSIAPYFLVLQAEALLQEKQDQQALAVMGAAISKLPEASPFYYIYKIKYASMQLQQQDEVVKQQGLEQLKALAENKKNTQQDQALYYLASYYNTHEQQAQAQDIFKQLLALKADYKEVMSPWILLAQEQIA